ncbi:MAG: YEATS-associated helix-containing protein [Saprospiraceae bacterium]
MYNIAILVSLIVAAGFLGGGANYYMEQPLAEGQKNNFFKSVLLGLTAAATVPLLLNTMSSSLMNDCIAAEKPNSSFFVFFGFCTVAAIFSSKFLQSLADKLLQDVKAVQQKQDEMEVTTEALVSKSSDPPENINPPIVPIPAPGGGGGDDEFESFKGASPLPPLHVAPALSDEQKIMHTLQTSQYAFRTVEGIAKDAGMDMGPVQAKLLEMEIQGKVKKTKRARDGAMVWCLR